MSENFEHALTDDFVPKDLKQLTQQICSGLEYLHEEGIAHGKVNNRNVVICNQIRTTYKIANFENAAINASRERKTKDVKDFGKMLMVFRCNIVNAKEQEIFKFDLMRKSVWRQFDDYCFLDMIQNNGGDRCTLQKIKKHPFLWSAHETLMFVVEIVKFMEPHSWKYAEKIFKKCSLEVFSGEDWRSRAREIVKIQTKTNKGLKPFDSLLGLLKTIRNLVRFCNVEVIMDLIVLFSPDRSPQIDRSR